MYERADPKAMCSGEGAEEFQASAAKDGDSFGAWARGFGGLGVQGLQPAASFGWLLAFEHWWPLVPAEFCAGKSFRGPSATLLTKHFLLQSAIAGIRGS